jgi:hypothetical protein
VEGTFDELCCQDGQKTQVMTGYSCSSDGVNNKVFRSVFGWFKNTEKSVDVNFEKV